MKLAHCLICPGGASNDAYFEQMQRMNVDLAKIKAGPEWLLAQSSKQKVKG